MKIVFASNNEHKVKEIRSLLPAEIELITLREISYFEDIEETGSTLEENAYIKAKTIFDFCGIPTIADDTGLEVFVLNHAPGVFSARYAGPQKSNELNINKLLGELKTKDNRAARFRTVFSYIDANTSQQFEGIVQGTIANERRGEQGFGYDSVFFPENENITFAEMPLNKKNDFSHRARALKKLVLYLTQDFKQ